MLYPISLGTISLDNNCYYIGKYGCSLYIRYLLSTLKNKFISVSRYTVLYNLFNAMACKYTPVKCLDSAFFVELV